VKESLIRNRSSAPDAWRRYCYLRGALRSAARTTVAHRLITTLSLLTCSYDSLAELIPLINSTYPWTFAPSFVVDHIPIGQDTAGCHLQRTHLQRTTTECKEVNEQALRRALGLHIVAPL
jgi:hypothetical protein